jgi:hypothetical protein
MLCEASLRFRPFATTSSQIGVRTGHPPSSWVRAAREQRGLRQSRGIVSARAPLALVLAKSEDFDSGGSAARRRGLGFSPDATRPGLWGSDRLNRATRRPFLILRPVHRGPGRLRDSRPFGPGIRRPFGPLNSAGEGWRMLARASASLPLGLGESVPSAA